jgi:hypothetical protein
MHSKLHGTPDLQRVTGALRATTAQLVLLAAAAASAPVSVVVDPARVGLRFDGIGGVSGGGGGTRLLLDYPEPERGAILDFLFKPGFGAALQVLKVEVGCDGDTTQGAEQSHMRTADDASPTAFDRGYENWLMVEAKQRNPGIHLSALEWGVPGWVADGTPVSQPDEGVAAPEQDGALVVSTDECSASEKVQQWTWNAKAIPGQICNGHNQCLNIPACQEGKEIILFGGDSPHTGSCVARCGCTAEPGKSCGIGPGDLDCIKNVQFNRTGVEGQFGAIQNAISGKFVQEDSERETLVLGGSSAGDSALWKWDVQTKLITNKASRRCVGRWQNAPPPPPPGPHPGPPSPPHHSQTTATLENIDYLVKWVQGLKEKKNLTMDSLGTGYNEGGFSVPWMKAAKKAFVKAGLGSMLTIGTDDCCGGQYRVVPQMMKDAELNASIDILGGHCTGVQNGQRNPDASVLALNKPLWNTEQHFGLPDPSPALCWQWSAAADLAQTLNQQYIVSNQTSVQMWTPIYSWYQWLPYEGKGLMVANRPWDGTYNVTDTIWVTAHTTQFSARGWHYLEASSLLPQALSSQGKTGGSIIVLASPGCLQSGARHAGTSCDFSVIIETVGATSPTNIELKLEGALKVATLNCVTTSQGAVFIAQPEVAVSAAGMVTVTVPADSIWTLSTLVGVKGGGGGAGKDQPQKPFPLPYFDDFETYAMDTLPLYFSDMHGAFAVASDTATAANKVLRQQAGALPPLATHGRSAAGYAVAIGDASWAGYTLSLRVMLELPANQSRSPDGFFYLSSHATSERTSPESSYHTPYLPSGGGAVMKVSLDGAWSIMSACNNATGHQCSAKPAVVGSGSGLTAVSNGKWMDVSLALMPGAAGLKIVAVVGGSTLLDKMVACRECHFAGPAFLGTGFHHASFDNFTVTPTSS